jgi:hypothetical protein
MFTFGQLNRNVVAFLPWNHGFFLEVLFQISTGAQFCKTGEFEKRKSCVLMAGTAYP